MSTRALYLIAKEKEAKTGYLDIGRCDLNLGNYDFSKVCQALEELSHLETLILSNEWYDWEDRKWCVSQNNENDNFLIQIPKEISKLVNLKKLIIAGDNRYKWEIRAIQNINKLNNLKYLDLSFNHLTKIEGLENLNNLLYLFIRANYLTKIEGLEALINLLHLDFRYNQLSKMECLESLSSLSHLDLRSNQLSKMECLKSLSSLSHLDLSWN